MFTGLVQHVGTITDAQTSDTGRSLTVAAAGWDAPCAAGDSIAINGVCLTVAGPATRPDWAGGVRFDAVHETLERSTLGGLEVGSRVNLEHAARADTLLGGHIVQGHVDAIGRVESVKTDPDDWRVRVGVPAATSPLLAPKGSVTVEGVSLTIAGVSEPAEASAWFEVALIPTTLDHTTLRELGVGRSVNIETDIIARQVVHALRHINPA